jgi:hypothetical protein
MSFTAFDLRRTSRNVIIDDAIWDTPRVCVRVLPAIAGDKNDEIPFLCQKFPTKDK